MTLHTSRHLITIVATLSAICGSVKTTPTASGARPDNRACGSLSWTATGLSTSSHDKLWRFLGFGAAALTVAVLLANPSRSTPNPPPVRTGRFTRLRSFVSDKKSDHRLLELQQPCRPTAADGDPENLYPKTNEDVCLDERSNTWGWDN
jgi:hypothetical protein